MAKKKKKKSIFLKRIITLVNLIYTSKNHILPKPKVKALNKKIQEKMEKD